MGNTKVYTWEGKGGRVTESDVAHAFCTNESVALALSNDGLVQVGTVTSCSMDADKGVQYLTSIYSTVCMIRVDLIWSDVVIALWSKGKLEEEQRYEPVVGAFWRVSN